MQECIYNALGYNARGRYALCSAMQQLCTMQCNMQLCTMHLAAMLYALGCSARGSYALCSALFRNAVSARQWIRPSKEGGHLTQSVSLVQLIDPPLSQLDAHNQEANP